MFLVRNIRDRISCSSHIRSNVYLASQRYFNWQNHPPVRLHFKKLESRNTDPSAPPVVIGHGMLASGINWLSIARQIQKETGRTVYLPDLRNHGQSPHSSRHQYQDLASDLKQFMEEHNLQQASVIGHSMGARSLMLIALVNDNDRIGNLVSVDASPIHSTTSGGIDFMLNTLDALLAVDLDTLSPTNNLNEGRKVLLEILTKNGVASELLRQSLAMKLVKDKETGKFYWQYNIKALRNNLLDHMLKVPEREHWKTFSKPTFILGGELSGYIPLDSHQAIREHFPNATFDYVSNAGHWVYADNPREFSRKLIAFLKDQES